MAIGARSEWNDHGEPVMARYLDLDQEGGSSPVFSLHKHVAFAQNSRSQVRLSLSFRNVNQSSTSTRVLGFYRGPGAQGLGIIGFLQGSEVEGFGFGILVSRLGILMPRISGVSGFRV